MAAATANMSTLLLSEVQNLCAEARRKHPDIKEAAERVIIILRGIQTTDTERIALELAQHEEVVKPFLLACKQTNHPKLVSIAMQCLQQLVSGKAIAAGSVRETLAALSAISNQGVDVQVKILQMVLPLVTIYEDTVYGETLVDALLLGFSLQRSRDPIVNNTAAAILRQVVVAVFDRVVAEDRLLSEEEENDKGDKDDMSKRCAKDAYFVLQDLCLLASGDSDPIFVRVEDSSKVDKGLVLELIESVLTNHSVVLARHSTLAQILRERLSPFIVNFFAEPASFPLAVRCARVLRLFVHELHKDLVPECEMFLGILARLGGQSSEFPKFYRVLAMECVAGIVQDGKLLRQLYSQYDGQQKQVDCHAILDLLSAVNNVATERLDLTVAKTDKSSAGSNAIGAQNSQMRLEMHKLLDKQDPPAAVPDTYLFYLSFQAATGLIEGLSSYLLPIYTTRISDEGSCRVPIPSKTGRFGLLVKEESQVEVVGSCSQGTDRDNGLAAVQDMVTQSWPIMLSALTFYMGVNVDNQMYKQAIKSTQRLTSICGVLELEDGRDAALALFCRYSLPYTRGDGDSSSGLLLHSRHIQCLRTLISAVQYLAPLLSESVWYSVLTTVQQVEELLYQQTRGIGSSGSGAAGNSAAAANNNDERRTSVSSAKTATVTATDGDNILYSKFSDIVLIREDTAMMLATAAAVSSDLNHELAKALRALCCLGADISGVPLCGSKQETALITGWKRVNAVLDRPTFAIEHLRGLAIANISLMVAASASNDGAWSIFLNHLLRTACFVDTPASVRNQACLAIADIVLAAMDEVGKDDDISAAQQQTVLLPLSKMANGINKSQAFNQLAEAQRVAVDTLHRLLQASDHPVVHAWEVVFDIIQSIVDGSTAVTGKLVRSVFPCLQLVCTEYLADLSSPCVRRCIESLAQFARQRQDLNIALTSIGQAWAVCDFFQATANNTNATSDAREMLVSTRLSSNQQSGVAEIVKEWWTMELGDMNDSFTRSILWMVLLESLAQLGHDSRHEVRLGAIQTLFRTLDMHGNLFKRWDWDGIMWAIVLPLTESFIRRRSRVLGTANSTLLENEEGVAAAAEDASRLADKSGVAAEDPVRLLRKQWDEMAATALFGSAKVWEGKESGIWEIGEVDRAWQEMWQLVISLFAESALSSEGVSAALSSAKALAGAAAESSGNEAKWRTAWDSWHEMGRRMLVAGTETEGKEKDSDVISEKELCSMLALSQPLLQQIKQQTKVTKADIESILGLIRQVLMHAVNIACPLKTTARSKDYVDISKVQQKVLETIQHLVDLSQAGETSWLSLLLEELTMLSVLPYASSGTSKCGFAVVERAQTMYGCFPEQQVPNFVALSSVALDNVGQMLTKQQQHQDDGSCGEWVNGAGWQGAIVSMGLHLVQPLGKPKPKQKQTEKPAAAQWLIATVALVSVRKTDGAVWEEAIGKVLTMALGETELDEETKIQVIDAIAEGSVCNVCLAANRSKMYWQTMVEMFEQGAVAGMTTVDHKSRGKKKVALCCFGWLLRLSSSASVREQAPAATNGDQVTKGEEKQKLLPGWVAETAAPALVIASQRLMKTAVEDSMLLGSQCPLPLAHIQLLRFAVEGLSGLQCREGALGAKDEGPAAHVGMLYNGLVDLLSIGDRVLVQLAQNCLRRIARA